MSGPFILPVLFLLLEKPSELADFWRTSNSLTRSHPSYLTHVTCRRRRFRRAALHGQGAEEADGARLLSQTHGDASLITKQPTRPPPQLRRRPLSHSLVPTLLDSNSPSATATEENSSLQQFFLARREEGRERALARTVRVAHCPCPPYPATTSTGSQRTQSRYRMPARRNV